MRVEMLLIFQVLYCVAGILYNLASWALAARGGKLLSPTRPATGIGVLVIYGLALAPGFLGQMTLYGGLMLLGLVVLGYGGVVVHLRNRTRPELYYSPAAWIVAIGINLSGAAVNAAAVISVFAG